MPDRIRRTFPIEATRLDRSRFDHKYSLFILYFRTFRHRNLWGAQTQGLKPCPFKARFFREEVRWLVPPGLFTVVKVMS